MKKTYNGNDLYHGVNFGLYGLDLNAPKLSMIAIKKEFILKFKDDIKKALAPLGLSYNSMKWYSPAYYNYENDSLDLVITVKNIDSYRAAIIKEKEAINSLLATNKSRDGYFPLTVNNIDEALKEDSPDIMILSYFLNKNIDFKNNFNILDYCC